MILNPFILGQCNKEPLKGVIAMSIFMQVENRKAEKPILFSTEMVKAILTGRKTQTRRVMRPQPDHKVEHHLALRKCPYGQLGDVFWVRETWAEYWSNGEFQHYRYKANGTHPEEGVSWKPSIHMPRTAARIFLVVKDIRIEQLQDIKGQDAVAEGIEITSESGPYEKTTRSAIEANHIQQLRQLWDRINVKRGFGWDTNPYVWVVEFELQ
jgi:hypothetical protein